MTKYTDLEATITSWEMFDKARRRYGLSLPDVTAFLPGVSSGIQIATQDYEHVNSKTLWPLQLDWLRESIGIYEPPTTVLQWLRTNRNIGQLWPHVSRVDRHLVAYTPDKDSGEKDRKRTMAMGRFVRMMFPLFTDNFVRKLEEIHRAELDPTIEIVRTFEDIEHVYKNMESDNGCMRYGKSHFSLSTYHPSAVYASPNFGVAVHRVGASIKARAVVWENPDDPSDKRYVRLYGDAVLQKKLERNGYKLRGLAGTKMSVLEDGDREGECVMPYLDPAGGNSYSGSKERNYDATYACRLAHEPDKILLLNSSEVPRYRKLGVTCVDAQTQSGAISIPLSELAEVMVVDALTGESFSRLEHDPVPWWNGALETWTRQVPVDSTFVNATHPVSGNNFRLYGQSVHIDAIRAAAPYSHLRDDERTLNSHGLGYLDATHYGERQLEQLVNCVKVGEGVVRTVDTYLVYETDEHGSRSSRSVHKDAIKAMRKMGYISVGVLNKQKVVALGTDPNLVETAGGRKAMRGIHDLGRLYDGQWEFTRNITVVHVGGIPLNVSKSMQDITQLQSLMVPDDLLDKRVTSYANSFSINDSRWRNQFLRMFGRFLFKHEGRIQQPHHGIPVTVEGIIEAAKDVAVMTLPQAAEIHYSNTIIPWARAVLRSVELLQRAYDKSIALAEASALECIVPQSEDQWKPISNDLLEELDRMLGQPEPTFFKQQGERDPRFNSVIQRAADSIREATGLRTIAIE